MARARRAQTLRVESGDRRGGGKHYAVRDVSETSAACVDLSTRWLQKETYHRVFCTIFLRSIRARLQCYWRRVLGSRRLLVCFLFIHNTGCVYNTHTLMR